MARQACCEKNLPEVSPSAGLLETAAKCLLKPLLIYSVEVAAVYWSNYKQHHTVKVLIGVTPNGAVSYISDVYGGRASDIFIVQDCSFLNCRQHNDEVMADRGFKNKDMLAFHQCTLSTPPSRHSNLKMTAKGVKGTSKIANVRIYIEQAIKRIN